MKRAVVTTTIYDPINLYAWSNCMRSGDIIIVSGDIITPHDDVKRTLDNISCSTGVETMYVVTNDTRISHVLPMQSIQRRNIAILEAIRVGADMITTVDTDNFPLQSDDNHLDKIEKLLTQPWGSAVIESTTNWFNAASWCTPSVHYRGWPFSHVSDFYIRQVLNYDVNIGVHSSLWLGDPDISAIERLMYNPTITNVPYRTFVLGLGTWCPFNSQATTYRRTLLPLLNVWPGIGRMDDIWPSYVAQHIMHYQGYTVAYGAPNVQQDRHEHDVIKDIEHELIGYRYTDTFLDALTSISTADASSPINALEEVFTVLDSNRQLDNIIPQVTRDFWFAWIADLRDIIAENIK